MNKVVETIARAGAKAVLAREPHGDSELTAFRLSVCQGCGDFYKEDQTCGLCGCFMDIKAELKTNINPRKRRLETTHCPAGKWNDKETANFYRAIDGKPLLQ